MNELCYWYVFVKVLPAQNSHNYYVLVEATDALTAAVWLEFRCVVLLQLSVASLRRLRYLHHYFILLF